MTVAEYARQWLALVAPTVRPSTLAKYADHLRRMILPGLGPLALQEVRRGDLRHLLSHLMAAGYARSTVRLACGVAHLVFASAIDDELILTNPAHGVSRMLRLTPTRREQADTTEALELGALQRYLAAAWTEGPRLAPLVELYARAGLRAGEALALQWPDVDFVRGILRVRYTIGTVHPTRPQTLPPREGCGPTKSGIGREVDIAPAAADGRRRLSSFSPWVFPGPHARPWALSTVDRYLVRVGRRSGTAIPITPRILRHTYASLLLQQGESPEYVSRQLGHSSLDLTIRVYGRWLRPTNPAAIARLDARIGCSAPPLTRPPRPRVVASR